MEKDLHAAEGEKRELTYRSHGNRGDRSGSHAYKRCVESIANHVMTPRSKIFTNKRMHNSRTQQNRPPSSRPQLLSFRTKCTIHHQVSAMCARHRCQYDIVVHGRIRYGNTHRLAGVSILSESCHGKSSITRMPSHYHKSSSTSKGSGPIHGPGDPRGLTRGAWTGASTGASS